MNKIMLKLIGGIVIAVGMSLALKGQDLTVTGTLDVTGSIISMGTLTGSTTYPGWQMGYTDGTTSSLNFQATRAGHVWKWWQNGIGTAQLQMTLDNNNTVTLYNSSGTAEITLNPTATSTMANSLTIYGTDNEMPNQTLAGANSVLTEGLADGRYISSSASSLALFPGALAMGANSMALGYNTAASGDYALASGYDSTASGTYSTAMGYYSVASGAYGSTALGWQNQATNDAAFAAGAICTASGQESTAMGFGATASGDHSFAIGLGATASNTGAIAMGEGDNSSGQQTIAIGYHNTSNGWASTAMGLNNLSTNVGTTAIGSDNTATGDAATTIGNNNFAHGDFATAIGDGTTASGLHSTALGYNTTAWVGYSTAFGCNTVGNGVNSTAMGYNTEADSFDSVVMGQFNVLWPPYGSTWIPTEPLFQIGNGADATHRSDALTVYKNGNATLQGTFTAPSITVTGSGGFMTTATSVANTDIPMFGH